jgi:hypothetical protein
MASCWRACLMNCFHPSENFARTVGTYPMVTSHNRRESAISLAADSARGPGFAAHDVFYSSGPQRHTGQCWSERQVG